MDTSRFQELDLGTLPSPCFVVHLGLLEENLKTLADVKRRTGCKILLALKSFSTFSTFPLIKEYLDGVCASSLHEARLGSEEFGKEVHVFAPAYQENDIKSLQSFADHIVFNSFNQWHQFKDRFQDKQRGIRINPEVSTAAVALYDPCAQYSRLGVTIQNFKDQNLEGIDGLHFHALCEQNSQDLKKVLDAVEKNFGSYLKEMKWLNFGGGHHITRSDYDVDLLCELIDSFQKKYSLQVYLEPGEAVALNAGVLVATVLDIVSNEGEIAILDTSAETHMPDVLAMPYRPKIIEAGEPGERKYSYKLGGLTCLAGDCIGDYSFDKPLEVGSKLIFLDMAHYSMVKTTTFNGVNLPSILLYDPAKKQTTLVREFGYEDFKSRL